MLAPRARSRALAALTCIVTTLLGACASSGADHDVVEANAVVTRHTDGDTLRVRMDGIEEKVRLIGIDTPESVHPSEPVECFGKEASAHLAELVPEGTRVRVVLDVEARDRYDRLLGYLFRSSDGSFVNLAMARDGYAAQLTIPPNVAHQSEIRAAVAEARQAGRGLWSACPDQEPGT